MSSDPYKLIGTITIPIYELQKGHFTGLRQEMLEIPEAHASLQTEASLGGDGIWSIFETKDSDCYYRCYGRDILAQVAQVTKQKQCEKFPVSPSYKI